MKFDPIVLIASFIIILTMFSVYFINLKNKKSNILTTGLTGLTGLTALFKYLPEENITKSLYPLYTEKLKVDNLSGMTGYVSDLTTKNLSSDNLSI